MTTDLEARSPLPAPYTTALLTRWQEPHRRYHTLTHLTQVLDHIDLLQAHATAPDLVRLAAWFHDAVYRPDRSTNEESSARLGQRALTEAGLPEPQVTEVTRLILLTRTHAPEPHDRNGQVLCDADLAILAAPPHRYAAYTTAVREEYHFIPDATFTAARADILRQLLALPTLFSTPHCRTHWEPKARRNLTTELARLDP